VLLIGQRLLACHSDHGWDRCCPRQGKRSGRQPHEVDGIAGALKLVAAELSPTATARRLALGSSTVRRLPTTAALLEQDERQPTDRPRSLPRSTGTI